MASEIQLIISLFITYKYDFDSREDTIFKLCVVVVVVVGVVVVAAININDIKMLFYCFGYHIL